MKFPDTPKKGDSQVETILQILRYLRAITVTGISGGQVKQGPNGTTLFLNRLPPQPAAAGDPIPLCPFGQIISYTEDEVQKKGIRGGLITCGDKNFGIPNQLVDPEVAGDWLVYIELVCKANTDDDNTVFLPGMETATEPTGDWDKVVWTEEVNYPDNTPPVLATGSGTIILPIGRLTIADGRATLTPTGCGNFSIAHCAGTLSYTRA